MSLWDVNKVSDDGVYQNLPPGRYQVRIVESDLPQPGQPLMTYCWFVNNQLDTQETSRQFTYTLESISVQSSAEVTQQGCVPISGTVPGLFDFPFDFSQSARFKGGVNG